MLTILGSLLAVPSREPPLQNRGTGGIRSGTIQAAIMSRSLICAAVTAILAIAYCVAQQPPAPGTPAPQAAGRGAGRGGFGGPIELGPDDKPAFPDPPAGFNVKRDNIPHGELVAVQYDSKSLGTRRRMRVYTPPGYSSARKYPVLYLLHRLRGNGTELTALCPRNNV